MEYNGTDYEARTPVFEYAHFNPTQPRFGGSYCERRLHWLNLTQLVWRLSSEQGRTLAVKPAKPKEPKVAPIGDASDPAAEADGAAGAAADEAAAQKKQLARRDSAPALTSPPRHGAHPSRTGPRAVYHV